MVKRGPFDNQIAQRLLTAILITAVVMGAEALGGIISNSLALLSDAGHMLTHLSALGLAWAAVRIARRPATPTKTFGYHRAEILAAFANGIILVLLAFYVFYSAYLRVLRPPEIEVSTMLGVATIGLGANLAVLWLLEGQRSKSINVRGAFLHVLSDTLSSVAVIAAGLAIAFAGIYLMDPLVSFLIGAMILAWSIGLIKEASGILLEAVPKHLNPDELVQEIKRVRGVRDLHDLHIWTIASGMHAMSGHLVIEDQMISKASEIVRKVNDVLRLKFGISHATVQLECERCRGPFVCPLKLDDAG